LRPPLVAVNDQTRYTKGDAGAASVAPDGSALELQLIPVDPH